MEFINRTTSTLEKEKIVPELLAGVKGDFDLAILFIGAFNPYDPAQIISDIRSKIQVKNFLACTCAGIIGSIHEVEYRPAASLMLARLPGVEIRPFHLDQMKLDSIESQNDWYEVFDIFPNENPSFLLLPDPYSMDISWVLEGMNKAYPGSNIVGGLVSGASQPGENLLCLNDKLHSEGMIGVTLKGNLKVDTIVSQGCRPFGKTHIITRADENLIVELSGKPFVEVLKEELESASQNDRVLAHDAIFVGVAMNEYTHQYKRGDFLIRGVLGIDRDSGAGVIGDFVESGQTIQFHLRDAKTAQEDLNELLVSQLNRSSNQKPKGAFIFSCNGRGENLFKEKDHDIRIIQNYLGSVPAAGFFCAGEIGPVAGINFLHGFTSSMVLFYPKS